MQNILIVVDMQNDFINGALGTPEAVSIVPRVKEKLATFNGRVYFTRDTHGDGYLETQEGRKLPVPHCIRGTYGWQITDALDASNAAMIVDKPTFGSTLLAEIIELENVREPIEKVTLVGLCTDICVISNAMLIKARLPEIRVEIDSSCCAGVTPESHENALNAMRVCQIEII